MESTEQAGNQPPRLTRAQAFRMALVHEAVARGVDRYTTKEFLAEFGEGQSEAHLYKSLRIAGWSQKMAERIDAFILRTMPEWRPFGLEADSTYTLWNKGKQSA